MGAKPSLILMDRNTNLREDGSKELSNPNLFKRSIGKLMYLTITKVDITHIVNYNSQFLAKPRRVHMDAPSN